jgi:hypothetical protein
MGWKFATPTTLFISSRVHSTALASYQNCTLLGIEKEPAQNIGPDSPIALSQDPAPQPIEDKFKNIQRSLVDVRELSWVGLSFAPSTTGFIFECV